MLALSGRGVIRRCAAVASSAEADVIYTTQWQTTGTSKADAHWRRAFEPFQVGQAVLDRWPAAVFMHDLPARRDDEVSAEVIDGGRSLVEPQAKNKLSGAASALVWAASRTAYRSKHPGHPP
jgi:ornithine carbamoyltransferase